MKMFCKTITIGIMILFVVACLMPNINSMLLKKDKLISDNLCYSGLPIFFDKTDNEIIKPFNVWTLKDDKYKTTHRDKDFSIKSNDPEYIKKSPMTNPKGKTLYVGGNGPGNYSTIELALYYATDGDTIFVYSGTYYVRGSGISIDKSINLIGENKETTIIDGSKPTIWIAPLIKIPRSIDGVTISGFTFQNSGGFSSDNSGITIHSNYNNISGNIFLNNQCGLLLWYIYPPCDHNIISNNIFSDNVHGIIIQETKYNEFIDNVFYNNGMFIEMSNNNIIKNNTFYNGGLWFYKSYQNTISGNLINDKPFVYLSDVSDTVVYEDAGQVALINCINVTVQNKDLSNTTIGLYLEDSHNCFISGNNFYSNEFIGIYLINSDNNSILNSYISKTSNGIVLEYSYKNNFMFNTISLSSSLGIYFLYSEENIISMNTFSDNHAGLILTGGSNYNEIINNDFTNDGAWVYGAWKNIFLNNSVNDKSLIYFEEESNKIIDEDVGQVILVNCDTITIKNQKISNIYAGIIVISSHDCLISDNIFSSNNRYGIFLTHSININISMNEVSDNIEGITLDISNKNIIFKNAINSNTNYGIFLVTSKDNSILRNTINSNKDNGIYLSYTSNKNSILSNTFKDNGNKQRIGSSIYVEMSSNNKIQRNNFIDNVRDPHFWDSFSNNWNGNYWDRSRQFPKIIIGGRNVIIFSIPWINVDWYPAKKPYDIDI